MRGPLALALAVALSASALGDIAKPTEASRLRSDAAGVFLAVMAEDDQPQRCQFDLNWNRYSIPVWLSKEELGPNAIEVSTALAEELPYTAALDPNGKYKQSFCSIEDSRIFFKDHPGRRTLYSFPVFAQDRNSAIVIDVEDVAIKGSSLFSITALILTKHSDGWRLDRYVMLGIS